VVRELKEETLDPEDWDDMRALGHRMLDDMMEYQRTSRDRPAYKTFENAIESLKEKAPRDPQGPEKAYNDFNIILLENFPAPLNHPRFWGWVAGTPSPSGMLYDMLTGALNQTTEFPIDLTMHIERQTINWIKEILGYPMQSSGLFVGGASTASLIGLTVARNTRAGYDIRKKGVLKPSAMTYYCSSEVHMAMQKTLELIGVGDENLRRVPVDSDFKIQTRALEKMIKEDRRSGKEPICVVGTAGTVNTGAFDDFEALYDVCCDEQLWFHVDGAFGIWTRLAPRLRRLTKGVEKADSLAFDLHKWISLTYDIGCVLVRDEAAHLKAFAVAPDYLKTSGVKASGIQDYGIDLSRRFRALKVWMSFKEHGTKKYGELVQQNVDQARYLEGLVSNAPDLELLAPVSLNIVCFRYVHEGLNEEQIDDLNNLILLALYLDGIAMPSSTKINGKFAIRFCTVNHRTRQEDIDYFIKEVRRLGTILLNETTAKEYMRRYNQFLETISKIS
jgi:aromatic-L-amino-acid decarboxylase